MNLKIFTDGGSRGNPGDAAIGVVVFSVVGNPSFEEIKSNEVIFDYSEFIGRATNNEAEYTAILRALAWLVENKEDVESVDFYLDSKLVVEQLNKSWKIKDVRMREFAESAWELLKKINFKVSFSHIKREKNQEADSLVNQALDAYQTQS